MRLRLLKENFISAFINMSFIFIKQAELRREIEYIDLREKANKEINTGTQQKKVCARDAPRGSFNIVKIEITIHFFVLWA